MKAFQMYFSFLVFAEVARALRMDVLSNAEDLAMRGINPESELATNVGEEDAEAVRRRVQNAYKKSVDIGFDGLRDQTGGGEAGNIKTRADLLGYKAGEIVKSADLGLGCGNPMEVARLQPGENVVDLGSGAGIDCFLAASQVAPHGQVIGVDMTQKMIDKANSAPETKKLGNVEFRLGTIEKMPIDSNFADVVISNCVINLSPEKSKVYAEMARVLKPGGRISISDVMRERDLPQSLQTSESHSC